MGKKQSKLKAGESGFGSFQLSARRELCAELWRSYGVASSLYPFLRPEEVFGLQLADQFMYTEGVGRVQTKFHLQSTVLLAYQQGLAAVKVQLPAKTLTRHVIVGTMKVNWYTVAVGADLFQMSSNFSLYRYLERSTDRNSQHLFKTIYDYEAPCYSFERNEIEFALSCVSQNFIFLTGGLSEDDNTLKTVRMLNLAGRSWTKYAAQMVEARRQHASCSLADTLYVFCGINWLRQCINSIERLDQASSTEARWQLIEVPDTDLLPRSLPCVAAINCGSEFAILGGYLGTQLGGVTIFNSKTDTCARIISDDTFDEEAFKFSSAYNQCAPIGSDTVVAFVTSSSDEPCLIQWTKGERQVSILDNLSPATPKSSKKQAKSTNQEAIMLDSRV